MLIHTLLLALKEMIFPCSIISFKNSDLKHLGLANLVAASC